MDFLSGFIGTIGLDKTFFLQFFLVIVLYFVLSKILFNPYLKFLEQRNALTKGKFSEGKKLESEIISLQKNYEAQSQKVNSEFQKIFSEIKQGADQNFKNKQEVLKKAQAEFLKKQKEELSQEEKRTEQELKKALPVFVEALVNKMKSTT